MTIIKTISITEEQNKYLREKSINLSRFVQQGIDRIIMSDLKMCRKKKS